MNQREFRTDLDFEKKKREFLDFLQSKENAVMVLATCSDNLVLARNVLVANSGLELYFFTWGHSRKCRQIQANPNIALCKDKVQIQGTAEILGAMSAENNKAYLSVINEKYPESVKRWLHRPGMVLVRVKPTTVVMGGDSDEPCLEFIDFTDRAAYAKKWAHY